MIGFIKRGTTHGKETNKIYGPAPTVPNPYLEKVQPINKSNKGDKMNGKFTISGRNFTEGERKLIVGWLNNLKITDDLWQWCNENHIDFGRLEKCLCYDSLLEAIGIPKEVAMGNDNYLDKFQDFREGKILIDELISFLEKGRIEVKEMNI